MKAKRWSKYIFKNGKVAKNRIVVPPMASQTADEKGYVSNRTIQHYENLSESGAGVIFVEYSYIHQSGKGEPNQLGVDEDSKISGLKDVSMVIQKNGSLAGIQLVHVGGKTSSELTGSPLLGPSEIKVPVKEHTLETPKAMSIQEINELIEWYISSAGRSIQAGFDIVELHAAHGYGLNQWLSPITNHRNDEFGGDIVGRSNLLLQIAAKIKTLFPDLLLAVRMPGEDHFNNGLTKFEMKWVAKNLEKIGVDIIDISSGIGGWRRPNGVSGQGYLVDDATEIKEAISLPVIGVGGITEGAFIDEIISQKKVDFAAVGRAILSSPSLWKHLNL